MRPSLHDGLEWRRCAHPWHFWLVLLRLACPAMGVVAKQVNALKMAASCERHEYVFCESRDSAYKYKAICMGNPR